MEIKEITRNKKDYLDLLLLADEQEDMIDRYLERGRMFALFDGELKTICVITQEDGNTIEIKNIATYENAQRRGYGARMIAFLADHFKDQYKTMLVGTGDTPHSLGFYEACGFTYSHRVPGFFTQNYDHPIVDGGILLEDMVYLKMNLAAGG